MGVARNYHGQMAQKGANGVKFSGEIGRKTRVFFRAAKAAPRGRGGIVV